MAIDDRHRSKASEELDMIEAMAADFERGLRAGRDPFSAGTNTKASASQAADNGIVRTTLASAWLRRLCPRCGHSFRLDDRIARDQGRIVHAAGTDICNMSASSTTERPNAGHDPRDPRRQDAARLEQQFNAGLRRAHQLGPGGPLVTTLLPGHRLLAPPRQGFGRKRCAVCGHTLRPYDDVVICPCQPHDPICQAAVHCDRVHQMPCLDDWADRAGGTACPVTSVPRPLGHTP